MAVYCLDSSALVKRYISETGSIWVLGLFDPALNNEVFIAAITGVEIIAAITRRSRNGSISITDATITRNQFKRDLQKDYQIVEITETGLTQELSETLIPLCKQDLRKNSLKLLFLCVNRTYARTL